MKERADGEHWDSENHSITETSIPVSEKPDITHKYINGKSDMGSVRLIFLLGFIIIFAHLCRREKHLRVQGKKKKEKQFIFKDLFTTGKI